MEGYGEGKGRGRINSEEEEEEEEEEGGITHLALMSGVALWGPSLGFVKSASGSLLGIGKVHRSKVINSLIDNLL